MFSFDVKPFRKKDGTTTNVILVTGDDTDSTYPYKDEMKNFGAKWINALRTWGWYTSDDKNRMNTIIQTMVRPAIEFLMSKEQDKGDDESRTVISVLDKILKILDTSDTQEEVEAANNAYMTKEEIKSRILDFKTQLVNTMNSADFQALLMPIIKARQAQGYKYSLLNTILIWCQDKKATMVKSKRGWEKMNRLVKPNAPTIGMYIPVGGEKAFNGKTARENEKKKWLVANGVSDESELTPGDKDRLEHHLNKTVGEVTFKFGFYFYDVRFTEQMEGKEDVVGDPNAQVDWYNDSGNETNAVKEKIECLLEVVKDSGVDVSKTKNLGGALGVSKGGKIEVLDNAKQNSNYLMTICHEFAHELLHQKYLHDAKHPEFGQFYFGRPEGRGFVEQQAELTAWIVCKFYGYSIREAINYAAIWGMNEKNAVYAFDTVAKVADFIINKVNEKIKNRRSSMKESKEYLNEVHFTGKDIANMVGAGDVYERGLEQLEDENEMYTEMKNRFNDLTSRINEAFKKNAQDRYNN